MDVKLPARETLSTDECRRAIRRAYANAAIWAIGNGLVSSTLVVYLALSVGARNFQSAVIFAAPSLAGLLRLSVPAILARFGHRKAFCIAAYLASASVLSLVPLSAMLLQVGERAPVALVSAWCIYHLFEYCGTVTLWSWLGDLVPRRIRGRLCGRREQFLTGGRLVGIAVTIALSIGWELLSPESPRVYPLALSAAFGAVFILLAVVPLALIPGVEYLPSAVPRLPWRNVLRAMSQRPYRQLVLFSGAFAFVNGITQAAQGTYPPRVLDIPYHGLQTLLATMRAGQMAIAPTMGRWCDGFGLRPVMIVSQLVVATGPLFLFRATRERWWWLVGAYVVWIAYAGLNVGLDNIKLKLAPPDNNAPYLAAYYTVSDVIFGSSVLAAGWACDRLEDLGYDTLKIYAGIFLLGGEPLQFYDLIAQDVSMQGKMPFLQYPVTSVVLLPGDEGNVSPGPFPKELVIDIPFVDHHNRPNRKGHRLGNCDFVDLSFGDMGKYRQVSIMVQKQMQLHRPFRLSKLGPIKEVGAQLDHGGIQAEELVPESKPPLAEIQGPALAQELVKYPLVQLPWPVFVGIGQRRSLRSRMEP
jgi:MFS family permease